jgi:putative transposase
MNTYKRHRFPPGIISYAVGLYFGFNLSHGRSAGPFVKDILAQRDIIVRHKSIRLWCNKFGLRFAWRLRIKHNGLGDTFYLEEVFAKIKCIQYYLWRAVDQDGEVVDVLI